ncbi:MAG: hypothetical protein IJC95_02820 [Clostridia bacterium]|nr:hypothetical protein [Clostridia bacterium]MBQ3056403.1 hypothetical protein [Clostridia bacterium]
MNITFIVFISVLSTLSLFATLLILYEMIRESGMNKRARIEADSKFREAVLAAISEGRSAKAEPVQETPVTPVCTAANEAAVAVATEIVPPVVEIVTPVVEITPPEAEEKEPASDNAANAEDGKISFSASQQQTLDEQYRALSKEQKRFYDKIAAYAASKEGSKCNKNQRYQEYKIGAKRIVRLRIKRGILHCEFLMINRDLRNHFSESKIPVKETATVIKVQNTETVQMVFSSIDLAIQLIEEERAYKKQLAKERRRQSKQQAKL